MYGYSKGKSCAVDVFYFINDCLWALRYSTEQKPIDDPISTHTHTDTHSRSVDDENVIDY